MASGIWVQCSERLPARPGVYLVNLVEPGKPEARGISTSSRFENGRWHSPLLLGFTGEVREWFEVA